MAKPPPIVKIEAQAGKRRADYGQQLLDKFSADLNKCFGRGFSVDHLELMRLFNHTYPLAQRPPPRDFRISDSEIHRRGMVASLSAEYRLALPPEKGLVAELE